MGTKDLAMKLWKLAHALNMEVSLHLITHIPGENSLRPYPEWYSSRAVGRILVGGRETPQHKKVSTCWFWGMKATCKEWTKLLGSPRKLPADRIHGAWLNPAARNRSIITTRVGRRYLPQPPGRRPAHADTCGTQSRGTSWTTLYTHFWHRTNMKRMLWCACFILLTF